MARRSKYRVFVAMPFWQGYDEVYAIVRESVLRAGSTLSVEINCTRLDEMIRVGTDITQVLQSAISKADIIIADISLQRPNVMMEVGYAQALAKPVIFLSQVNDDIPPFNLRSKLILIYETGRPLGGLLPRLTEAIVSTFEVSIQGKPFGLKRESKSTVRKRRRTQVFISYCHEDRAFLHRLLVHLRPLEKKGLLELWADTKIRPGDDWKKEITDALSRAKVAILLVTADFLASDFIIENELPPLLTSAENEGVRIIPVILKPCRFLRDDNLSKFHAINNPDVPLMKLMDVEQEEIYARLAEAVEYG